MDEYEIVRRLRKMPASVQIGGSWERDCYDAADAIERLTKERDEAWQKYVDANEARIDAEKQRDAAIARAEAAERHIENALHSYQTMVSWLLSPYNQPTPRLHANSSILIGPEVDIRAALTALRARIAAATGEKDV